MGGRGLGSNSQRRTGFTDIAGKANTIDALHTSELSLRRQRNAMNVMNTIDY